MAALLETKRDLIATLARGAVRVLLAAAWIACGGAMAAADDGLYRAQTVVTGQGEPNRIIGFGACLEDVLIKVSGQPMLAGDRRLAAYKSKAKEFVSSFDYHDQYAGKPHHDEQGTRDRPYDLTVDFDDKKIDGILARLDLKPWRSRRPVLGVFAEMQHGPKDYIVTSDGTQSDLQRDALAAAAGKRGMRFVLPDAAALTSANLTAAELSKTAPAKLSSIVAPQGGEATLLGRLVWNDKDLGWATQWRMAWNGKDYKWQFRGVTFDEAFRRGIGGAAQLLSGNGDPGRSK
ncbi:MULTISPECIES: DUF2066 domain-containing protein [Bradyrhizobium]|uniref:DUF2066 domain-containing protein n=1 Tax=Bradyrhizobium elkanii TaxID=29448 RepID=UPI0027150087|nr:DUF2066 domain-containing protein [Bradyrhizobium elkanii]WLA50636.1 DUF2066 domain-containing protein [Bradyrhizobium elkanii]WLB79125.1 DUF2066 domain-containing protein [Bradyrhizobium elkanii]